MGKKEKDNAKSKLLVQRDFFFENLNRAMVQCDTEIDNWPSFEIESRIAKAQNDFQNIEMKTLAIISDLDSGEQEKKEAQAICIDAEKLLFCLTNKLKMKWAILNGRVPKKEEEASASLALNKKADDNVTGDLAMSGGANSAELVDSSQAVQQNKEEKIVIDKFIGIVGWDEFQTQVEVKLMSNEKLSEREKFEALAKACVGTAAEPIVCRLAMNDFKKAYNKLSWLFGSKYKQAMYYIHELLSYPQLNYPNGYEVIELVKKVDFIVDKFKRNLDDNLVHFIPWIVIDKMDVDSRFAWERQVKIQAESWAMQSNSQSANEYTTDWQSVKQFLEGEAELMLQEFAGVVDSTDTSDKLAQQAGRKNEIQGESMAFKSSSLDISQSYANTLQANSGNRKEINNHCYCDTRHPIHKCDVLLAKNLSEREKYMEEESICTQCLWSAHPGKDCLDPLANRYCNRCAPTKVKHNSLLCPVSYDKAQEKLAIVTPMNSFPNWQSNK